MPLLFSDLLIQKPKNTLLPFFVIYFISRSREIYLSNLLQIYLSFTWEGLTTALTRRVASIHSLCAGIVYIVLRGYPTGLRTLVSSLREIPTVAVLHHPFLLGENTDTDTSHQGHWGTSREPTSNYLSNARKTLHHLEL